MAGANWGSALFSAITTEQHKTVQIARLLGCKVSGTARPHTNGRRLLGCKASGTLLGSDGRSLARTKGSLHPRGSVGAVSAVQPRPQPVRKTINRQVRESNGFEINTTLCVSPDSGTDGPPVQPARQHKGHNLAQGYGEYHEDCGALKGRVDTCGLATVEAGQDVSGEANGIDCTSKP